MIPATISIASPDERRAFGKSRRRRRGYVGAIVNTYTELETKVLAAITEHADPSCMDCVDMSDLVRHVGEPAKVLRGVVGSLVKKDAIEIEYYDPGQGNDNEFYWLPGAEF